MPNHQPLTPYRKAHLNRTAFPLGGIGAGMLCLDGTGGFSHFSVRNRPDVMNVPYMYAAVCVKGKPNMARVLEGPVPPAQRFGFPGAGNGGKDRTWGLPRFRAAEFEARFPFGTVKLKDKSLPLAARVVGWSPFLPGDADASSLPVAALEYRFRNRSDKRVEVVFSFNAKNVMAVGRGEARVDDFEGRGFVLRQLPLEDDPAARGAFCAFLDEEGAAANCAWFRGGWFDPQTMAWRDVLAGEAIRRPPPADGRPSPGASLYVPFALKPGEKRTVRLMLAWHVPASDICFGDSLTGACTCADGQEIETYSPWYAGAFASVEDVARHWGERFAELRRETRCFSKCFFDTDLPAEAVEAVAANLSILKSPTCLRQKDGRFWGWEGCSDAVGCCAGSCTHVWNYAQALCHLFPALERTMRETEFGESQDERGHQRFRAAMPIREADHAALAAADGQLGGILKLHRDWRIAGDDAWLRRLWPKARQSLDYCIETWDPGREGLLSEPHHNTYDIEFWGPDGMCSSFYLGALKAAALMGEALGDNVAEYADLHEHGRKRMENELFNGEYFVQKVRWKDLRAPNPAEAPSLRTEYSPEALELLEKEGPKYQYGEGCLADGVLGAWMAAVCGVGDILDPAKVRRHLLAVHRHNLRRDLTEHANPQRPGYAMCEEGGLLLCTWPRGGEPSLPFVYSNEAWTGIEYQVASHLILMGCAKEGLDIVRTARARHDGRVRNPFDEYECGHWYARALSSYALLQALSGARYDAAEKTLHLSPRAKGDFRAFLCTAGGYGTVGVRKGKPFIEAKSGRIEVNRIEVRPKG